MCADEDGEVSQGTTVSHVLTDQFVVTGLHIFGVCSRLSQATGEGNIAQECNIQR